jgi:N-methylhydantoinase A
MELDVEAGRAASPVTWRSRSGRASTLPRAMQRIVNANMANAVRKVLSQHGADPRTLSLVAYGGGGPVHAWAHDRELGIGRVLVPKASPASSALGLLVSDYVVDLMRAYVVKPFRHRPGAGADARCRCPKVGRCPRRSCSTGPTASTTT